MPVNEIFPMLITCNFLEIKGLLQLLIKAVALKLQEDSVEKIRKDFNVPDPNWTKEDLKRIEEENAWADPGKK